ncbi:site-specific DNA-methyltransferase [Erysipelothrix rhusiopathiae]|uniref:DNA methyltransferase n=1 Tax=Erysipelothrix rhusiopathiae TaxID=1648 RepID=UPI001EDEF865|nr:DNA methyltransferase [Erysipelothrix rhusiopathiae]MCG4437253.1 site-specific DNA-methyltransferase [Erysipelothrix rhusiopathiae]
MSIHKTINFEYDKSFWDFEGIKKEGIHTLGKYPATMVAQMQSELLKIVIDNSNTESLSVLDPFMGTATSLVESQNFGAEVTGIDINPYATLLSEVKLFSYNYIDVNDAATEVINLVNSDFEFCLHSFPNIKKWYRADIINDLSKIKSVIEQQPNLQIRKFLWVCFSETALKFSNSRTSTFKLHSMKPEDIVKIKNTVIPHFISTVNKNKKVLNYQNVNTAYIHQGDSLAEMSSLPSNKYSIVCTSPPYGDNQTTVTYGQFSILPLKWISISDLGVTDSLLDTYSGIDSASLGGKKRERENTINLTTLDEYIGKISKEKQQKVINFFEDYYLICKELVRVIIDEGYIMMTVGNRRVDRILQPLDDITTEIMLELGMTQVTEFHRNIPTKAMPWKVSKVKSKGSVKSMSQETVLIYKKEI